MQSWRDGLIAVDWGTTNRRAYRLDADGKVCDAFEDERGVLAISDGGFAEAVGQITDRLGQAPLLLAGMIGSNRGWREAPYVPCPVTLAELASNLLWIEPNRVAIVPGVSFADARRADVMRGEEVQAFGYVAQSGQTEALLCHPGTHTKWIRISGGAITRFRTFMTGELYALLRDHSILSPLLQAHVAPDEDFLAGVAVGLGGASLAAELFSIRARVLLGRQDAARAASWASGLLVGADICGGLEEGTDGAVIVLGRPSLTCLYAAALERKGARAVEVDGGPAFVTGMHAIGKVLP